MIALRELYQEVILDHNRHPRNHREIVHATAQARGYNPLCGDKLTLFLNISNGVIQDISFIGCGCAISQASASLMTEALRGKTTDEAQALFECFHETLTAADHTEPPASLGKLAVLAGVRAYPARVKCATLAWHTLDAALKKKESLVTTE